MTKYLLFLCTFLYATTLLSQSTLTNREAFDFAVGDTFHYEGQTIPYYALSPRPEVYTQIVVVSKQYFAEANVWGYSL